MICAGMLAVLNWFMSQVVWLDVTAARSRYGAWIGGCLPEFVPFPRTGRARGGAAKQKAMKSADAAADAAADGSAATDAGGVWEDDNKYLVRLRRLRYGVEHDGSQLSWPHGLTFILNGLVCKI